MPAEDYRYRKVILKLSGEALSGRDGILDFGLLDRVAATLVKLSADGVRIGVVLGAGNIWRGRSGGAMDRVTADRMGMLATVINSLAMADAVIRAGGGARVMTSTPMEPAAEYYRADRAREAMENGEIAVLAGGTGNPYFSTDTAAVLRAAETGADALLLAKNVDGIYDSDPSSNPGARRYDSLSYAVILEKRLRAIDLSAAAMGLEFGLRSFAFKLSDPEDIARACMGRCKGTLITP
jgi:uridylate kinase